MTQTHLADGRTDRQTDIHNTYIHTYIHTYRYVNSDKRSDILIFDPGSDADIELDVLLADPWCLDSVKAASREEGVQQ